MEEGVDTVSNGVLLLFRGQDCLGNLVWWRVLTQLVTGCCCCLEDKTFFWKSRVEEGVDTVGNGVLLLFGGQDSCFWISWVEEGVDTVGNGVLLLFGGQDSFDEKSGLEESVDTVGEGVLLLFGRQDVFGDLGWRRVLTQLVTGCCCCLEDKKFLEISGGGGC